MGGVHLYILLILPLRRSDCTIFDPTAHLTFSDVSVDDPKRPAILFLNLKKSKTDPFRRGVRLTVGSTQNELCPVSAMLAYLALRGPGDGPLFRWQDGSPLTQSKLVVAIRDVLTRANLPSKDFAGHSFRIGAATTAASMGVEDSLIQTLGRWKSSAYLLYVRLEPTSISKSLSGAAL